MLTTKTTTLNLQVPAGELPGCLTAGLTPELTERVIVGLTTGLTVGLTAGLTTGLTNCGADCRSGQLSREDSSDPKVMGTQGPSAFRVRRNWTKSLQRM